MLWPRCSGDSGVGPVAGGGDDFPNSRDVPALGKTIASRIDQYAGWAADIAMDDSLADIDAPAPSIPRTAPEIERLARRRKSDIAIDSVIFDTSDIHQTGELRIISLRVTDLLRAEDTLAVRWDTALVNGTDSNLVIFWARGRTVSLDSGSITTYAFEDATGDGIINNPDESRFVASATYVVRFGELETRTDMVVDAGPDRDFDLEDDNRILAMATTTLFGGDTIGFYRGLDADGDSAVLDNGLDSNRVDIEARSVNWATLTRSTLHARFVVFADSSLDYPVKYRSREESIVSNWRSSAVIRGMRPDSSFFAHDTAIAELATIPVLGDSVDNDSVCMVVRLGAHPADTLDDSLISVYARTRRRLGAEKTIVFSFVSDAPIPAGQSPAAGTVTYEARYRDERWVRVEGTFNQERIEARFTTSEEADTSVVWDREGNPVP
jgi:hypothetical protein